VWTVQTVVGALGDQVIKAPSGSTVSNPAFQETIATYEMTFATPGTYTAYYRVRGFNGSSDSFYSPDGFGVNPDNNQTTNQTGEFFWKKDSQTFTISAGNVDVPLEFRLGMREANAEIDAIVLNLSSSLTAIQLDDLFAVLPGDYNLDGTVDALDYTVWRNTFGSLTELAADGDGSGEIDAPDYDIWKMHYGQTAAGAGSGGLTAVPEPTGVALSCLGGLFALLGVNSRRRSTHRFVVLTPNG
jgi:hypothetical protein